MTNWKKAFLDSIPLSARTDTMDSAALPDLVALEQHGILAFEGEGAAKLLQGQLTCDVEAIAQSESVPGALCNNKGRVLAIFRLYRASDRFLMLLPRELISSIQPYLDKYLPFFQCNMIDRSDEYIVLLTSARLHTSLAPVEICGEFSIVAIDQNEVPAVQRQLLEADIRRTAEASAAIWSQVCVENWIPELFLTTREQFLPADLNLDLLGHVSFSKGCYTGQEIVARMHYRSSAKKRLAVLCLDKPITALPGDTLKIAGDRYNLQVVSESHPHEQGSRMLVVAPVEAPANGSALVDQVTAAFRLSFAEPGAGRTNV